MSKQEVDCPSDALAKLSSTVVDDAMLPVSWILSIRMWMKPEIIRCEVFDGAGIRRFKAERRFKAFYKRFIYKPEEKK